MIIRFLTSSRFPIWNSKRIIRTGLCFLCATIGTSATGMAQQSNSKSFNATEVFREMDQAATVNANAAPIPAAWWDQHVSGSLRDQQPLPADIHTLLYLALQHSNQIKIAKRDPLIRQTAILESDSRFDWVQYLNASWEDSTEPIGNSLTAGGIATQFEDNVFQATGGVRRLTRYGGILDISQRFGWQDNNSTFLVPDEQATGQFTVSYTHPLLRGRGEVYNNSLVFLAQLDAEVAEQEFLATLQDELLDITRSYWALYLERATLAHQMRLYLKTQGIYQSLVARQSVDTQRTQLVTAASALENQRADLIRARTAVTNAETRLRGLINAPELGNSDEAELIPVEAPSLDFFDVGLQSEIQKAIQNRPEVKAAIQQVKAGSQQVGIAEHEMLPALNLVTQGYLNGLQGDSDFARAFGDQFSTGRPSYSVGIQYELPIGNRLAKARLCRRKHELARLQDEYSRALQAVQTEVDIAVRELKTAHQEVYAKYRALSAAEAEANTIEQRWLRMADGSGTAALNLESLLRALERITEAERDYVTSQLTYNLASINLKRTNGTLLQSEDVIASEGCENGCRSINLTKADPVSSSFTEAGDVVSVIPQTVPESYPTQAQAIAPVVPQGVPTRARPLAPAIPQSPAPLPPIYQAPRSQSNLNYYSQ